MHFKWSYENTVPFVLLHVCRMFLHLSFKYLLSISMTPPCHLSLCTFAETIFLLLWPPSLTPAHLQGPCVCDLPWLHCSELHIPALGSLGAVMTISVYCLLILWLLVLFAHKFMSPWRGQAVSFCEEPGTDLWLWKFVEWMFRPCWIDWKMFEIVTESLLLERVKWGWSVWSWFWPDPWVCTMLMSPWCEGWFILICVHSIERGHLHRALNSCLVCWCFL